MEILLKKAETNLSSPHLTKIFLGNFWRFSALCHKDDPARASHCLKQAEHHYKDSEWGLALTYSLLARL
jgi:hypothetical protein